VRRLSICRSANCGFAAKDRPAGQNGLDDIIQRLASDAFGRLRVGIGPVPDNWNGADFVLGRFDASERKTVEDAVILAPMAWIVGWPKASRPA